MTNEFLGWTYSDRVTAFEGVAVGYCEYISGCNQVLLVPKTAPDGEYREGHWFDVQRLEKNKHANRVALENGATPGFDKAAPKR